MKVKSNEIFTIKEYIRQFSSLINNINWFCYPQVSLKESKYIFKEKGEQIY